MSQQERHDEIKNSFSDVAHWISELHKDLDKDLTEKRTLDSALAMCKLAMESMYKLFEGLEDERGLINPGTETIVVTDGKTKNILAQLCEVTGTDKSKLLKSALINFMMTSNNIAKQLSIPDDSSASQALAEYLKNKLGDN